MGASAASRLDLPDSQRVLAALVTAFDLRAHAPKHLADRSVRAYLDGSRGGSDLAERAHAAIGEALLAADLTPDALRLRDFLRADVPTDRRSSARAIAAQIAVQAGRWDDLVAAVRTQTAPVAFVKQARAAAVRVVAIDLAVRLTGVLWLARHGVGSAPPLYWLSPNGIGMRLRHLCADAGISRAQLAKQVGVHLHTVDGWFDAAQRPGHAKLEALARKLTPPNTRSLDLRRELQLAYGLRSLIDQLGPAVGELELVEIVGGGLRLVHAMLTLVSRSRNELAANDDKMRGCVVLGADRDAAPWTEFMLRSAWRNELDPVWRTAIRAVARRDWLGHLQLVTRKLGPMSEGDLERLTRMYGGRVDDDTLASIAYSVQAAKADLDDDPAWAAATAELHRDVGPDSALDLKIRAAEIGSVDLVASIALLREAARRDPGSAEIHFRLGASLWQIGEIEEGLVELRVSKGLAPDWDRVRVEIAIVLGNRDRHDDALSELRDAERELTASTSWVTLHIAHSLEMLRRTEEAAREYERYVAMEPGDGEAVDRLAHLRFVLGDAREGARLAKTAARLGVSTVFDAWQRDHYRGKGEKERPAHAPWVSTHFGPRKPWSG